MSERLELVTDFSSLRSGMLVVVKPCGSCGGASHRGMLMSPNTKPSLRYNETIRELVFPVVPATPCSRGMVPVVCAMTVAKGYVFRVVDDQQTQVARAREMERTS